MARSAANGYFNNGQRDAGGRLAHLFGKMLVRMNAVGLACGEGFLFPANQSELADATGLTTVQPHDAEAARRGADQHARLRDHH